MFEGTSNFEWMKGKVQKVSDQLKTLNEQMARQTMEQEMARNELIQKKTISQQMALLELRKQNKTLEEKGQTRVICLNCSYEWPRWLVYELLYDASHEERMERYRKFASLVIETSVDPRGYSGREENPPLAVWEISVRPGKPIAWGLTEVQVEDIRVISKAENLPDKDILEIFENCKYVLLGKPVSTKQKFVIKTKEVL